MHYSRHLSILIIPTASAFVIIHDAPRIRTPKNIYRRSFLSASEGGGGNDGISTFERGIALSKGLVSSLTSFVNRFSDASSSTRVASMDIGPDNAPPATPEELVEVIRNDYVNKNYLWTGDIHAPAFERDCRFTDPTLSFEGIDTFLSNVKNLRPIVDYLTMGGAYRSDLLDISLNEKDDYVQSRWNMVGSLERLPWKPTIDVVGRTKFWFRPVTRAVQNERNAVTAITKAGNTHGGFRVYSYEEEWDIPAYRALMQLVTPAGTVSSHSHGSSKKS